MNIPLPTYGKFFNLYAIAEAIYMFVNQIDSALKSLTQDCVRFHSKNYLVKRVMHEAKMFPCMESYLDVETYLGEKLDELMRKFGENHEEL